MSTAKQEIKRSPKLRVIQGEQVDLRKWVNKMRRRTPPKRIKPLNLNRKDETLPTTVNEENAWTVWATIRRCLLEEKTSDREMRDYHEDFKSWLVSDPWFVPMINAGHLSAAASWFLDAHDDGADGDEEEDDGDDDGNDGDIIY